MGVRWGVLLLGLGLLSACTVLPTGPSVFVLPAVGKSMDVFQVEEGECRSYAQQQLGVVPEQAASARRLRYSMTEPISNVCTPKGMWCPGWPQGPALPPALRDAATGDTAALKPLTFSRCIQDADGVHDLSFLSVRHPGRAERDSKPRTPAQSQRRRRADASLRAGV